MPYTKQDIWEARCQAHQAFDRLWKLAPFWQRKERRQRCYNWLAKQMGMTRKECHIRYFDVGLCEAVIQICDEVRAGLREGPNPAIQKRSAPIPKGSARRRNRYW